MLDYDQKLLEDNLQTAATLVSPQHEGQSAKKLKA
jgi:hypothetical protein